MLTLRKIIDMVDDGHVDYSPEKRLKLMLASLLKIKKYNKLNIYIMKRKPRVLEIGRHVDDNTHAIFFIC